MNEFGKLNRDQMRKITGGGEPTPPVCLLERTCYVGLVNNTILWGVCTEAPTVGNPGCRCEHNLSNDWHISQECFLEAS